MASDKSTNMSSSLLSSISDVALASGAETTGPCTTVMLGLRTFFDFNCENNISKVREERGCSIGDSQSCESGVLVVEITYNTQHCEFESSQIVESPRTFHCGS